MNNLTDRDSINIQDRMAISKHPKLKGAAKTFLSRAQFAVNCDHTCLCDAVFCVQAPDIRDRFWLSLQNNGQVQSCPRRQCCPKMVSGVVMKVVPGGIHKARRRGTP